MEYSMTPPTTTASDLKIVATYAGFWRRVGAYMLDGLILYVATLPMVLIYSALYPTEMPESSTGLSFKEAYWVLYFIPGFIISWLYFALMECSSKQGTVGKIALGIRVTDLEGSRIDFLTATGRFFAKIISTITLGIGFLMAAFTPKKQALHDLMAATLVVGKERIVPAAFVKDLHFRP